MKDAKKSIKEQRIIEAAESVFNAVGFSNAKMSDIAKAASITKVTLYTYFQSKENLQLAITYKALCLLIDKYYSTLSEYKDESGLKATIAISELFIDFNQSNFLYSEALLSYFELIRSTAQGTNKDKLTDGVIESAYFKKLQEIQNLPFKLTVQEINRGKKDGSIKPEVDPMLATLAGWSYSIGYIKLLSSSGNYQYPLFNVDLRVLKKLLAKSVLDYLKMV